MWLHLVFNTLLLVFSNAERSESNDNQLSKDILEKARIGLENSPLVINSLYGTIPLQDPGRHKPLPVASEEEIKNIEQKAETIFKKTEEENIKLFREGIDKPNSKTPIFGPHLLTDKKSIEISKPGTIISDTTKGIVEVARQGAKKSLLNSTQRFQIFDLIKELQHVPVFDSCPFDEPVNCDFISFFYRKIDGSCNNWLNPLWGRSFTPFERFLVPHYDGPTGTSEPRITAQSGLALPSAREVSVLVHTPSTAADLVPPLSYFVMQFGQFLDHDITKTALSKGYGNSNLGCCDFPHRRDCFPIDVATDDHYFGGHIDCLNFVRSLPTPALNCSTDYRQQLNELTHFIDASNVYGSTEDVLSELRDAATERMKTSAGNRLPLDDTNESECQISVPAKKCFKAGDKRANVIPGLSALHNIWLREHNRIADYLKANNPSWSDETVFQQARRFLIAEMQHITYKEFLPKILHDFFLTILDLKPKSTGFFTDYDTNVKPMIRNAFATAAFRFGHSLLRDHFFFNGVPHSLHTQFNNADLHYEPQGVEGCTRGLYTNDAQKYDEKLTTEITNKLFETLPFNGGDLAAFNIQRGRDHGLPSYNKWVEHCYGPAFIAHSFLPGQFGGLIFHSAAAAMKLEDAYDDPDDIDLFTGAMSENNLPGSRLGPTFSCILGLQFKALKYGDRFYYEGNAAYSFSSTQLDNIRQTTMARVICQNTDISTIQRDVFLEEDPTLNPLEPCNSLPELDLPCTPVDGGWGPWIKVNFCKEVRHCNNPTPTACGQKCFGISVRFTCLNPLEPAKAKQSLRGH